MKLKIFAVLTLIYFITRLYNLTLLPIFFDEANYLFWAKEIAGTATHWFVSLTSGKPPLLIWIIAGFMKILPVKEFLLAGRLPSVLFGFINLLGIYFLSEILFKSKKIGYIAAFLYIVCPFTLFHDRMVLYDSQLSAMCTWSVYFLVKTQKSLLFRDAALWGLFLGLAFLSKATSVSYFVIGPVIFFILLNGLKNNWRKGIYLTAVALFTSQIIANLLIISRGYLEYLQKSLPGFTPTPTQLLTNPFRLLFTNSISSFVWLNDYLTTPLFVFGLISILILVITKPKIGLSLFLLFIFPIAALSSMGRIYIPRYFLFAAPYILISCAYFINLLFNIKKIPVLIILVVILYLPLRFDYFLLTDPAKAYFPEVDRFQYITGFPSGYGIPTIYKAINKELVNGPMTLVVEGSYSHYPNAFILYYWDNPNIKILERWPLAKNDPELANLQETGRLFFVLRDDDKQNLLEFQRTLPFTILAEGKKPGNKNSVFFAVLNKVQH